MNSIIDYRHVWLRYKELSLSTTELAMQEVVVRHILY
jgi:hypothetical protein